MPASHFTAARKALSEDRERRQFARNRILSQLNTGPQRADDFDLHPTIRSLVLVRLQNEGLAGYNPITRRWNRTEKPA